MTDVWSDRAEGYRKSATHMRGDDDHVGRRHRQAGAVAEDADAAVELHVGDTLLARERLEGIGRLDVAHLGDVGVAEQRAVVHGELRVERFHLAVGRHDQRVDLAEHGVRLDEAAVELADDLQHLPLLVRVVDAGAAPRPRRRRRA